MVLVLVFLLCVQSLSPEEVIQQVWKQKIYKYVSLVGFDGSWVLSHLLLNRLELWLTILGYIHIMHLTTSLIIQSHVLNVFMGEIGINLDTCKEVRSLFKCTWESSRVYMYLLLLILIYFLTFLSWIAEIKDAIFFNK